MKFEPRRGQAIGRVVIRPTLSTIVRPDETKGISKFVLLDAVGPDLEAKGLKAGDVVLPIKINTIYLDGGGSFRPMVEEGEIALIVRDWKSLDEFHVQTENGAQYVPFSDPKAAVSLGVVESRSTSQAAAA
jgi:hypothetical protein